MHLRLSFLLLVLTAAPWIGCDYIETEEPGPPTITVTAGTPPGIEWLPQGAKLLRVYRGSTVGDPRSDDLMWEVTSAVNGILSPALYGTPPAGSVVVLPARPLQEGQTYTVEIRRVVGVGDERTTYAGSTTFTY